MLWIRGILLTGGIPYREVLFKESREPEWFIWAARVVDRSEDEGRMQDFKAEGTKSNPLQGEDP